MTLLDEVCHEGLTVRFSNYASFPVCSLLPACGLRYELSACCSRCHACLLHACRLPYLLVVMTACCHDYLLLCLPVVMTACCHACLFPCLPVIMPACCHDGDGLSSLWNHKHQINPSFYKYFGHGILQK